ncbi:MAG: hypothetical protein ACUZ8E_04390 [Candidatus Anammoxibacter sp.]
MSDNRINCCGCGQFVKIADILGGTARVETVGDGYSGNSYMFYELVTCEKCVVARQWKILKHTDVRETKK